jgi:hypothetical protein
VQLARKESQESVECGLCTGHHTHAWCPAREADRRTSAVSHPMHLSCSPRSTNNKPRSKSSFDELAIQNTGFEWEEAVATDSELMLVDGIPHLCGFCVDYLSDDDDVEAKGAVQHAVSVPDEHSDALLYSAADPEYECITSSSFDQQDEVLDVSKEREESSSRDLEKEEELVANLLQEGMDVQEPEEFSGCGLISPCVIQSPAISEKWPVTANEQGRKKKQVCTCTDRSMHSGTALVEAF